MSPFFGCYNLPSHIISGQTFASLRFGVSAISEAW
jgi:hypothetical protein